MCIRDRSAVRRTRWRPGESSSRSRWLPPVAARSEKPNSGPAWAGARSRLSSMSPRYKISWMSEVSRARRRSCQRNPSSTARARSKAAAAPTCLSYRSRKPGTGTTRTVTKVCVKTWPDVSSRTVNRPDTAPSAASCPKSSRRGRRTALPAATVILCGPTVSALPEEPSSSVRLRRCSESSSLRSSTLPCAVSPGCTSRSSRTIAPVTSGAEVASRVEYGLRSPAMPSPSINPVKDTAPVAVRGTVMRAENSPSCAWGSGPSPSSVRRTVRAGKPVPVSFTDTLMPASCARSVRTTPCRVWSVTWAVTCCPAVGTGGETRM